jgi:hypothetical protein
MAASCTPKHLTNKQDRQRWQLLYQSLRRAKRRQDPHEVDVDVEYLMALGDQQHWKCALTGQELEFTSGGEIWGGRLCNPRVCTIDRIDNTKGYIDGNVQLLMWSVNHAKGVLTNKEFVSVCEAVAASPIISRSSP